MKLNKAYTLKYRRRREGRTDYKARLELLKSKKLRVVVRRNLNNIFVHLVEYDIKGDRTIVSGSSRELIKYEWKAHRGNTPTAYLTGLLCGMKAKKAGFTEGILDLGLYRAIKGSSIFAAVKGIRDAEFNIGCNEEYFPNNDRIEGKHAKTNVKNFKEVKEKIIAKWQ